MIAARKALLHAPEMIASLERLAARRPAGPQSRWAPRGGLAYYLAAERLENSTDRLFTVVDFDRYTQDWKTVKARINAGAMSVGTGFAAGRPGRGRTMAGVPIELAVRSLALRLGGCGASAADERAADERNSGRPFASWVSPSTVAVYRKRLRDRLGQLDAAESVRVGIAYTTGTGKRLDGHHPSRSAWERGCRCDDCVSVGDGRNASSVALSVAPGHPR